MPIVKNSSGSFDGVEVSPKTDKYLGIKFANSHRFSQPDDVITYSETVIAKSFGPQSPQVPGFMEEILKTRDLPSDENCQYLNIWTPKPSSRLKPVLFWIHGGAYTNGTGATSWYDGKNLCELGDVVVVTINYRLGPFGFIGYENYGTLDQMSALRWVNRNIDAFGGDPNNVTIFGESAGGSSVVALTASSMTKGLVTKAWAMSPSLQQLRSKKEADVSTQQFLETAKCSTVEELTNLPTQQIIDATAKMFENVENYIATFSPTCGSSGLPEDIYANSAKSGIPLVVGTNRDENRLWSALNPDNVSNDEETAKKYFKEALGDLGDRAWSLYTTLRPNQTPIQMVAAMQTDQHFRSPAWDLCETRVKAGASTWMYWFTWPTPIFDGIFGCCHALDLPFMFHNLNAPNVELFTGDAPNRTLIADTFSSELLSFAKDTSVSWPEFDLDNRATLQIDLDSKVIKNPEPELRELWSTKI